MLTQTISAFDLPVTTWYCDLIENKELETCRQIDGAHEVTN
jgi:hypothetical protein